MLNVLLGEGSAEITEKRSRFIATAKEVHSEEEALAFIASVKKRYWDAKHNCFAYVIGENAQLQRFSDDGEPSGTAGKPILNVIQGNNLTNTVIVVTRYFGGILLGTGGLVRAYTDSSAAAVKALKESLQILEAEMGEKLTFTCDYKAAGKIDNLIASSGVFVLSKEYAEAVSYEVALGSADVSKFKEALLDATDGRTKAESAGAITFLKKGSEAVFYEF